MSKVIQSGLTLGKTLGNVTDNLGKKALIEHDVPLAKNFLSKMATKAFSFVLDKFGRKITGQSPLRAGKVFTLLISNEDMDDIIKIVKSLEKSSLLIDATTEPVQHKLKKVVFLGL